MNQYIKLLAFATILASSSTVADAETITRKVSAGKTSQIYALARYNKRACRGSAPPKVRLTNTANGKLTSRRVKYVIPKKERCSGNTFYYTVIYYTPNRGFRGKDTAKFIMTFPMYTDGSGHAAKRVTAKIQVK